MKKIILSIVLLNPASSIQAAQAVELETPAQLVIADIQPFSAPFTEVPLMVFANPPYRVCPLSSTKIRRAETETVTMQAIRDAIPRASKSEAEFENSCLRMAEFYDWLHAINFIESHLSEGTLSLDLVQELNARMCRLTIENPGDFRTIFMKWEYDLNVTEEVFLNYTEREALTREFFRHFESTKSHPIAFCETIDDLVDNKDRYLRFSDRAFVATESVKRFLRLVNESQAIRNEDTYEPYTIDAQEADRWEAEDRSITPLHPAGWINIHRWWDQRRYLFCDPGLSNHA